MVPDYIALVKFLIEPLLDRPDALSIDCEINAKGDRVRIRLAFDLGDKGRVFGRNGRNIQAVRTIVTTAAQASDQTVYFDIYDPNPTEKFVEKEVKHNTVPSPIKRKRID